MSGRRLDPTVFIDVCFLEVLPRIGSVMNVAEDKVTNLAMDPLPFLLFGSRILPFQAGKPKNFQTALTGSPSGRNSSPFS